MCSRSFLYGDFIWKTIVPTYWILVSDRYMKTTSCRDMAVLFRVLEGGAGRHAVNCTSTPRGLVLTGQGADRRVTIPLPGTLQRSIFITNLINNGSTAPTRHRFQILSLQSAHLLFYERSTIDDIRVGGVNLFSSKKCINRWGDILCQQGYSAVDLHCTMSLLA